MSDDLNRSWVCAWAAAQLNSDKDTLPKSFGISGSTCRMQFRTSIAGSRIRLTFSNEYSETLDPPECALEIKYAEVALLKDPGSCEIIPGSARPLTFGGADGVDIPAGKRVTSDAVDFTLPALGFVAVTVSFGRTPAFPSCHREADCSSWLSRNDAAHFTPDENMWSYFSLCRADVLADKGAETIVCFGDSITDGAVSTFNGFDAWPDILGGAMQKSTETKNIAVVNSAIAGNAIYGGWGAKAMERFSRDVLEIPGVTRAIILIGTNDIPGAENDISDYMIKTYSAMVDACREKGIKVYAGTVTPFGNNEHWASALHEGIRKRINEWMMAPDSGYNGFIDFASAARDPEDETVLKAEYDSGDGLHPSAAGHHAMGAAAVSAMMKYIKEETR